MLLNSEVVVEGTYRGWTLEDAKRHHDDLIARLSGCRGTESQRKAQQRKILTQAYLEISANEPWLDTLHRWSWINSKDYGICRFNVWEPQRQLIEYIQDCYDKDIRCEILILKPRQLGFTTVIQNLIYHMGARHPYWQMLLISHKQDATDNIAGIPKFTHEHIEIQPDARFTVKRGGEFANGSRLFIETAGGKGVGRSWQFKIVHISEAAWCEKDYELIGGLSSCLPERGFYLLVQETTANGEGNQFHDVWVASEDGRSDYYTIFWAWWQEPRYRMALLPGEDRRILETLDPEERDGIEQFGWTLEQIKWRRHRIYTRFSGDIARFRQEFPSYPEEAFLVSGRAVFDRNAMLTATRAVREIKPIFRGDLLELGAA